MTGILEVIGSISELRKAIALLKSPEGRKEFSYPNDHFKRIGAALSTIYFPENGILSVLRKIEASEKIDDGDLGTLSDFNQREYQVSDAIDNLVLDYGKSARNSIKQSRIFADIKSRKMSVRGAVQSAVNEALTFGKHVLPNDVAPLIAEIEQLNRDIEEAEHELRQFI
jgi:hypothetical protein